MEGLKETCFNLWSKCYNDNKQKADESGNYTKYIKLFCLTTSVHITHVNNTDKDVRGKLEPLFYEFVLSNMEDYWQVLTPIYMDAALKNAKDASCGVGLLEDKKLLKHTREKAIEAMVDVSPKALKELENFLQNEL